ELREQVTDRLFDADADASRRVGAAARLVPSGVAATIAQRAFGPLLCARVAGAVDAGKAIDIAKRLPAGFLADVTVELDPRRVAAIIAEVPEALVVPVAEELGRRGEHVTMGRFLAYVPDHGITGAIGVLSDEAMLHTAFVLEHKERLDHAVGLLPPERLPGILRRASELALWPEALDLLDHLSEERRWPIADVVAAQDEAVITELIRAVAAAGIWDSLLPVVRTMSEESRLRLAATPVFHEPAVMRAIVEAAAREGLWVDLVPLLDALPADARNELPAIVAGLDRALLHVAIGDAARRPDTLETLLGIVAEMDADGRRVVAAAIDDADREAAEILVAAITDPAERARLLALVPDDVMEAIERAAARFGMSDLLAR
ncbi:MAG TPA: hypothetical protein VFZ89_11755, partial [Solirubrobacteraceae bacterium]